MGMKFSKAKQVKSNTKIKSVQKFNRTKAKNKLDKLFSLRIRSVGKCQLAGLDNVRCSQVLQCAHIIGRANLFLRWNPFNALSLCSGHHIYYTYHPEGWRGMMQKFYNESYVWLLQNMNEKIKFNEQYYLQKLKELT